MFNKNEYDKTTQARAFHVWSLYLFTLTIPIRQHSPHLQQYGSKDSLAHSLCHNATIMPKYVGCTLASTEGFHSAAPFNAPCKMRHPE